jgi:threonine/homoserine/homoserine lactone efflux protein
VYLGVKMVLAKGGGEALPARFAALDFWAIYRQGLFTNLLNPKVVLFFLAFIPQFISPESSQRFAAFLTLGLCVVTTGTLWCLVLANFSGWLSQKMRRGAGNSQWLNRAAGGLFVYLGVRLAAVRA